MKPKQKYFRRLLHYGFALAFSLPLGTFAQEFQYSGDDGPQHWHELSGDWGACEGAGDDAMQSPIDIRRFTVDETLGKLDLVTVPTTVDIFNNGHTIEQQYEGTGSAITFEGVEYELSQFHFHTYSEHKVQGKHGALELHAVFQNAGTGDYVVIGQLYEIGKTENAFIQTLIDEGLPELDGDETVSGTVIDVGDAFKTLRTYYSYSGSLTTPPCSETVNWVVLAQAHIITMEQADAFRDILGNNFRPEQALNGRTVRGSGSGNWRTDL